MTLQGQIFECSHDLNATRLSFESQISLKKSEKQSLEQENHVLERNKDMLEDEYQRVKKELLQNVKELEVLRNSNKELQNVKEENQMLKNALADEVAVSRHFTDQSEEYKAKYENLRGKKKLHYICIRVI